MAYDAVVGASIGAFIFCTLICRSVSRLAGLPDEIGIGAGVIIATLLTCYVYQHEKQRASKERTAGEKLDGYVRTLLGSLQETDAANKGKYEDYIGLLKIHLGPVRQNVITEIAIGSTVQQVYASLLDQLIACGGQDKKFAQACSRITMSISGRNGYEETSTGRSRIRGCAINISCPKLICHFQQLHPRSKRSLTHRLCAPVLNLKVR